MPVDLDTRTGTDRGRPRTVLPVRWLVVQVRRNARCVRAGLPGAATIRGATTHEHEQQYQQAADAPHDSILVQTPAPNRSPAEMQADRDNPCFVSIIERLSRRSNLATGLAGPVSRAETLE